MKTNTHNSHKPIQQLAMNGTHTRTPAQTHKERRKTKYLSQTAEKKKKKHQQQQQQKTKRKKETNTDKYIIMRRRLQKRHKPTQYIQYTV